jgi:ABC-type glycerol-3-phosphate transport system substrate-binding protein
MRRIVILTALGLLLGLVLAACGGNASSAGDQAETPAVSADRAQAIAQNMLVAHPLLGWPATSRM